MNDNDQHTTSQEGSTATASSTGSNNNDYIQPLPIPDPALMSRTVESVNRDRNSEKA
jgi:hypothetical protein